MEALKREKKKKSNQGFSLFTVMVAVSFVGILGLLVLYMAMANFQMKVTDIKGKDGFYTAERALEEIRVGLQEDVGDAMSTAYIKVLETYSKLELTEGTNQSLAMDEIRQLEFQKLFVQELEKRLCVPSTYPISKEYDITYLDKMLEDGIKKKIDATKETLMLINPNGKKPELISDYNLKRAVNGVKLKNLRVVYVDPVGHASIIDTDIRLGIPQVHFPTPSTLPDLMNLIVVANKGIICNSENVNPIEISGDIYAGIPDRRISTTIQERKEAVSIKINSGSNLHLKSGNRLVCQGLIDVDHNGSLINQGMGNLWARGIQVSSGHVVLTGKTYIADDLTVETGHNSIVSIEGSYNGFGSPNSARQSKLANSFYSGAKDTELSSAIVINGKNTTIDLSKATDITLAGRSYIATSKIDNYKGTNKDIIMGESLTVKGTQIAYLLPPELIGEGKCTNPMDANDYENILKNNNNKLPLNFLKPVNNWGGRSLSEIGIDSEKPVEVVYQNDNTMSGKVFVYFYLNFVDDQKAVDFMQMIYANNSNMKRDLDKYLGFYFGDNAGIKVNNNQSYLRYVTKGNVLTYDGNKKNSGLNPASGSNVSQSFENEQVQYQNSWYCLNQNMKSYVNEDVVVKDANGKEDHKVIDYSYTVFDNLVNENGLREFMSQKNTDEYTYTMNDGEKYQAVFLIDKDFTITKGNVKDLRLVVSTGNVRIEPEVEFKGIIMAKGTITLGAGAHLTSNSQEAMQVFQSQSAEGGFSPKDIFWDGNDYVLGNSVNGDNETKVSDFYDLAECVTYENWKKR